MRLRTDRGFSLIELVMVVLVMGMLLAFLIPGFRSLSTAQQLKGASENIAGQLRLAREKAIGTGVSQTVEFRGASTYRVVQNATILESWTLPNGVTFSWSAGTDSNYTITRDGRMDRSAWVILTDRRGIQDTVSIQLSGLVVNQ